MLAGKPIQDIEFTRDRRMYRLKLANAAGSTDRIVAQARRQAEVSR